MVKLVGGTSGLNVTTKKPDKLVGSERGSVGNMTVVIPRLTFLRELKACAEFVVDQTHLMTRERHPPSLHDGLALTIGFE